MFFKFIYHVPDNIENDSELLLEIDPEIEDLQEECIRIKRRRDELKKILGNIIGVAPSRFSINDKEAIKIIKFAKSKDIKIAINVDRLFHQDDLKFVKSLLETCPCDYIIYSDLGIYQFLVEIGLTESAIYRAPTYLTNYNDIKIYQRLNKYVVASNQITSTELKEIVEKSDKNLIAQFSLNNPIKIIYYDKND